ncbi:Uncharacterised protein [Vibrio cholerae]|nr:Uncharacterised protein [Vibrio cholerae]
MFALGHSVGRELQGIINSNLRAIHETYPTESGSTSW